MGLGERAYEILFGRVPDYVFDIKYSNRLKDYNANVRMTPGKISFHLNKKWEDVDEEITLGLLQSLIAKLFKSKRRTTNINMYETFIKSLGNYGEGKCEDEELLESFNFVNENLFGGMMDMPNIRWGKRNKRKLGSYNFHTDTITISSIFKGHHELINAIMHHELLHKKLKFKGNRFHTKEFRELEKRYDKEKEISDFLKGF